MFHIEGANSMYVMAVGQYLLRENLVKGKKWYSLTADYAFGHDLLRVAKKFMEANGGQFAADELVPTDAADFSPYLLKIRQARPDLVVSNRGNQITNSSSNIPNTGCSSPSPGSASTRWWRGAPARAISPASGRWSGITSSIRRAQEIRRRLPEEIRQASRQPSWGDYNSLKIVAQSMNDT